MNCRLLLSSSKNALYVNYPSKFQEDLKRQAQLHIQPTRYLSQEILSVRWAASDDRVGKRQSEGSWQVLGAVGKGANAWDKHLWSWPETFTSLMAAVLLSNTEQLPLGSMTHGDLENGSLQNCVRLTKRYTLYSFVLIQIWTKHCSNRHGLEQTPSYFYLALVVDIKQH